MTKKKTAADWFEITAFHGTQELWAIPNWEGKPEYGNPTLEDGREIYDLIARGELDQIPFPVWFERDVPNSRGRRRGDLLWSGGLATNLVSQRFADVVAELGVTGVKTYDVELIDPRNGPIEGYVGFVPSIDGTSEISCFGWPDKYLSFTWIVSARVLEGLKERDADRFRVESLREKKHVPRI